VDGVQSVTIPRTVVRIRDVKLAALIRPNVGYIQLSGFASETGKEMRQAITYLQQASIDANSQLEGLVLDMRGNPGGLLTSAVDVASLFVPKGSDIVSAKGRGFPGVLYRSRVDPLLDDRTKLAVLVNGQTASAAEIVAGAIQDLDVGVIVGADRTFGKGLVQNVQELPFDTALKFTVAKYYTPSGRCIQGIKYQEGGGVTEESARFVAKKVADKDRNEFLTRNGRVVKDGGGIEADFKVDAPKASALEVSLLRSGAFSDFASEWSKHNELTSSKNVVDEDTYKRFIAFVNQKQRDGDLQLEELYERPLVDLKKSLKRSGYMGSEKLVEQLQASIVREMQKDFARYRTDIAEDISQNILARYLPESMLIERSIQNDRQVDAAVKLVTSTKFDRLLASNAREDGASVSDGSSFLASSADGTSRGGAGWVSSATAPAPPLSRATMDGGETGFRASVKF
jgi:carboxyl-terminal processing protease